MADRLMDLEVPVLIIAVVAAIALAAIGEKETVEAVAAIYIGSGALLAIGLTVSRQKLKKAVEDRGMDEEEKELSYRSVDAHVRGVEIIALLMTSLGAVLPLLRSWDASKDKSAVGAFAFGVALLVVTQLASHRVLAKKIAVAPSARSRTDTASCQ